MQSSTINADLLKALIPILTFFLGVGSTWWFKLREKKEGTVRSATTEIGKLVTDWYHQLDEINAAIEQELPNDIINQKIVAYSQNRYILPQLQQNHEIISGHPKCIALQQKLDQFLNIVTKTEDYNLRRSGNHNLDGLYCVMCNATLSKRDHLFQVDYSPLLELRKKVDSLTQTINKEVGKVLKNL